MVSIPIYRTTTTVSLDEINQVLNKGQQLLADMAIVAGYAELYRMNDETVCTRLQLYLYLYAIQNWDVTPNALNWFSQDQLVRMMSKVEQLFYIVSIQKPC